MFLLLLQQLLLERLLRWHRWGWPQGSSLASGAITVGCVLIGLRHRVQRLIAVIQGAEATIRRGTVAEGENTNKKEKKYVIASIEEEHMCAHRSE